MSKTDVVIVGSGAAGSLLAAKLSQAGKKVILLEAGPKRGMKDLYSSQLFARRLKWGGPPMEMEGNHPLSVHFGQGWGTGGSAMHHYACWFRLHAEDFEMKTRFGRGQNWPMSYDELRPYYDQVQKEVGLSGDAKKEVWRPPGEPYPMPPLPVFTQGMLIAEGFRKMGLRTSPLPMAINSVEYNGRPNCIYDAWCDAGCPTGALGNPLAVYLDQALKAGAQILHHSYVTRVLTAPNGKRVTGVEYFNEKGERHTQEAGIVILAAFALQNPRILLNSATKGLANSSGLVGKYFMAHTATNIWGMFKEDTQNFLGVTGGQLLCQENYEKNPKKGYLGSSQWLIGNALKPNDLLGIANARPDLFGAALHEFFRKATKYLGTMTFIGENLPVAESQMKLIDKKDKYGMPLARISHSLGADDIRCYEEGVKQGLKVFQAAGATEPWSGMRVSMHVMGGTIMGSDARNSVTNSYGGCHDHVNLFLAGSGIFPTSGAVNPTFTINALALRTAKHINENWGSLIS